MKNTSKISLLQKITVCLLAGLTSGASFNRLASRLLGWFLPAVFVNPITLLIILAPVFYTFFWHYKSKVQNEHAPEIETWQGVIRFALAFDLSMFGWFKLFQLQFWVPMEILDEPVGSISGQWLTWVYFGRSYPMAFTIGALQITASLLLLFGRTRLIGVFMMLPILLNVFLIDIFYEMGWLPAHAGIMLAAVTYLLLTEYERLKEFFINNNGEVKTLNLRPVMKLVLRSSIVVIPILFISFHKSADQYPQLKGKYEVMKIAIDSIDETKRINCDSVLSVVYLEVGNTCVLQFKNYKQRLIGIYDFEESSARFNVEWINQQKPTPKLEATLIPTGDKKLKLSGKIGQSTLEAELSKVK